MVDGLAQDRAMNNTKTISWSNALVLFAQSKVGLVLAIGLVGISLAKAVSHYSAVIDVVGIIHVAPAANTNRSLVDKAHEVHKPIVEESTSNSAHDH